MKKQFQNILKRAGVYERTKASWVYDFYWSIADKRVISDREKEVTFYGNLLTGFRKGDLIFDIGANVGYKVGIFLKMGASVVAVEPDDFNQEILKQKFFKLRVRKKPVVLVGKAVSEQNSVQKLYQEAPGSALNTLSTKWAEALHDDADRFGHQVDYRQWKEVETVTLEQLIAQQGTPFYVKIDVEGHEVSVLRGLRQPVPYLSFEVNLPEFRKEGLECLQVLGNIADTGEFNYTSDARKGLDMEKWVSRAEMSAILDSCAHKSIEIYWRTGAARRRP